MKAQLIHHESHGQPRATILLTHGFGEHQGRYARLVEALTEAGYDVFTYDQYGHGTSPGPRAQVDVGALINDHLQARRDLQGRQRTEKTVLFGHSMGGLITAASALINPNDTDAVVLSGPALALTNNPLPPRFGHIASRLAEYAPGLPMARLDSSLVSRDPQVVADYDADPLNYHGAIPFLTAATMIWHGHEVLARADRWTLPLLVIHGDEDELASVDGSWQLVLCAVANGADAELVEVPGAFHEVFNEPEAPQLRAELLQWLESRLS